MDKINSKQEPIGKLIAVGGAVSSEIETEHRLEHYEEGILAHIISLASEHTSSAIEIISSASSEPDEAASDYIQCLNRLGCEKVNHLKITTRKEAFETAPVERLAKCNCVIFTGGDQLRLCEILGDTPLINLVWRKYQTEKFLVVGISAGAAAMTATMIAGGLPGKGYQKGSIQLSTGFGFLDQAVIDTHFNKRGRFARLTQAVLSEPSLIGIGLGENTGIEVSGDQIKAIGSNSVVIIDGRNIGFTNYNMIGEDKAISASDVKVHMLAEGDRYSLTDKVFIPMQGPISGSE